LAFSTLQLHPALLRGHGKRKTTRALVLAPTRELALQILEDLNGLARFTGLKAAAVHGGVGMGSQEAAFRQGADVIVATPGRLLDHFQHDYAALAGLEYLVLDEALVFTRTKPLAERIAAIRARKAEERARSAAKAAGGAASEGVDAEPLLPGRSGAPHIGPSHGAEGRRPHPPSNRLRMRAATLAGIAVVFLCAPGVAPVVAAGTEPGGRGAPAHDEPAAALARDRLAADLATLREYRPSYPFWRHVFAAPDGQVLFGSGSDGRILARFPTRKDWTSGGSFEDQVVAGLLAGQRLQGTLTARRKKVAKLLEPAVGPVVHNPTRGDFVTPNVRLYGGFLDDWAAIYERFGAPGEIGLAQAMVESGFNGKARSRANAHGLCQFLKGNWNRLNRLTPHVIEVQNQTTQAAYCAAYLTVLSTKYGSFIPALSEHHAGGANVGRVLINGARLGAVDVRRRYFEGSDFARDLRAISTRRFRDVVGTYGVRSAVYAEMVFANAPAVDSMRGAVPQERIHAMRTTRAVPLQEIVRQTGLSEREVKRFNPALVRQVPKGATLYLPEPVERFGADVSFWLRPASPEYAAILEEFVALSAPPEEWEDPAFQSLLTDFRRRFRDTGTEEGTVMDAVLAYVMQELPSTHRVLDRYRSSPKVLKAFDAGVQARQPKPAEAESQH